MAELAAYQKETATGGPLFSAQVQKQLLMTGIGISRIVVSKILNHVEGRKMKLIGLLGGTNWKSTIDFYERINNLISEKKGRETSARILLWSINYSEVKKYYRTDWPKAVQNFKLELNELEARTPDCIVVCNHTLHKALDEIQVNFPGSISIFHSVKPCAERCLTLSLRRVLVMGTKFLMEAGFFAKGLTDSGIGAEIPPPEIRRHLETLQNSVLDGRLNCELTKELRDYLQTCSGKFDAVILACTELPEIFNLFESPIPTIDPGMLQCEAAVGFALST